MFAIVKTVADANSVIVKWADIPGMPPNDESSWMRPNVFHMKGAQGSLAGANGSVLFDRAGLLWLELYCPVGAGKTAGYAKGQPFVDTLEKASTLSLWFRNVRLEEGGSEGNYVRTHVKAEFEYSDVK